MRRASLNARLMQDAEASGEIYAVLFHIEHADVAFISRYLHQLCQSVVNQRSFQTLLSPEGVDGSMSAASVQSQFTVGKRAQRNRAV